RRNQGTLRRRIAQSRAAQARGGQATPDQGLGRLREESHRCEEGVTPSFCVILRPAPAGLFVFSLSRRERVGVRDELTSKPPNNWAGFALTCPLAWGEGNARVINEVRCCREENCCRRTHARARRCDLCRSPSFAPQRSRRSRGKGLPLGREHRRRTDRPPAAFDVRRVFLRI